MLVSNSVTSDNIFNFSAENYELFIRENFNKPDEIWRHAYEQQILDFDRILLNTMLSFGNSVKIADLEVGFQARIDYEVKFNNYLRPFDAFRKSFRKLEGGLSSTKPMTQTGLSLLTHP